MPDPNSARPASSRAPSGPDPSPERPSRRIPPLVWIILALLVLWLAIAAVQRGGFNRTPHGGTAPSEAEGASYMPAAPARGSAPATPAATINGPNQPATDNAPKPR